MTSASRSAGRRTPAAGRQQRPSSGRWRRGPRADVGRDLVVAAAAGVELAADVADAVDQGPLDVRVNVFELLAEREIAGSDLAADCSRPATIWCRSSAVRTPTLASMRAWAMEPSMSCA